MQHFVQRYIRSVLIPENYHAYRVAHKDDVDATLIEQTRGGIIVRRKRGNLLTTMLHLPKILHGTWSQDQLAISERKPRQKAVRGRPAPPKLTRDKIRLAQNFVRSALECDASSCRFWTCRSYHSSANRITPPACSSLASKSSIFLF